MSFQSIVDCAISQAAFSDCAKSRRGVVVFDRYFNILGAACNGQPRTGMHFDDEPLRCPRTDLCRASCRDTAVHAEIRALRQVDWSQAPWEVQLLHVKVDNSSTLIAGGPPSCVQCSREILDCGRVSRVWLYEKVMVETSCMYFSGTDCHRCLGDNCATCDRMRDHGIFSERCDHDHIDRHDWVPTWRSYDPLTFHQLSLHNSLKDKNPHA